MWTEQILKMKAHVEFIAENLGLALLLGEVPLQVSHLVHDRVLQALGALTCHKEVWRNKNKKSFQTS